MEASKKKVFLWRVARFSSLVLPFAFGFYIWECSLNPGGVQPEDYLHGLAVTAIAAVTIAVAARIAYIRQSRQ